MYVCAFGLHKTVLPGGLTPHGVRRIASRMAQMALAHYSCIVANAFRA